jgi:hypothetical protein
VLRDEFALYDARLVGCLEACVYSSDLAQNPNSQHGLAARRYGHEKHA